MIFQGPFQPKPFWCYDLCSSPNWPSLTLPAFSIWLRSGFCQVFMFGGIWGWNLQYRQLLELFHRLQNENTLSLTLRALVLCNQSYWWTGFYIQLLVICPLLNSLKHFKIFSAVFWVWYCWTKQFMLHKRVVFRLVSVPILIGARFSPRTKHHKHYYWLSYYLTQFSCSINCRRLLF